MLKPLLVIAGLTGVAYILFFDKNKKMGNILTPNKITPPEKTGDVPATTPSTTPSTNKGIAIGEKNPNDAAQIPTMPTGFGGVMPTGTGGIRPANTTSGIQSDTKKNDNPVMSMGHYQNSSIESVFGLN